MITQELKEAVVKEALLLRKHSTKQEKRRLNAEYINYSNPYHCLYGQLTGNCGNDRAMELFRLCAKPFSETIYGGTPIEKKFYKSRQKVDRSAIEFYIAFADAKIKTLIKLIKS